MSASYEVAMMPGHTFPDQVCPKSRVNAGNVEQCRKFEYMNRNNFEVCVPHLSNTSVYYQMDSVVIDQSPGQGSMLGEFHSAIENVMSPECAHNILSMVCQTLHKECQEVQGIGFVPALMC